MPYARFTQSALGIARGLPVGCLTAFCGRHRGRSSSLAEIFLVAEPFDLRADPFSGTGEVASPARWSNQDEVDQRKNGRSAGGGNQGVVGPGVRIWVERRLRGFFGHTRDLRRPRQVAL